MAKTKLEKENTVNEEAFSVSTEDTVSSVENNDNEPENVVTEKVAAPTSGPTYDELIAIVQQLAGEVRALKSGAANTTSNDSVSATANSNLTDILSALANRKSDREVSIVHNCELLGGLTTHIELSNATIDFRHLGETRLLSWQQFEECASKYRSFFDSKIILVDSQYAEVAEQYNLPCKEGLTHALTQKDISKLTKMTVPELENFIESLGNEDKDTIFSYWLGKCYSREAGFYDRHKMDTLNRLSDGMFDNILLVMNGDGRNIPEPKNK